MKARNGILAVTLGFLLWLMIGFGFTTIQYQNFFDWLIFKVPSNELNLGFVILAVFALASAILLRATMGNGSNIEELRKANGKLTSLLDNLPVGVYRIASNGQVLQANRQFAKTLGYETTKELRSLDLNEVYTNKLDRHVHLEKLREGPVFAEFEIRRKDGRTVWIREYPKATLRIDGTIDYVDAVCVETHGMDAIMRDLAEHKRLQSMKDNFTVAVTHELRTPLVSIKGYIDHIMEKEPNFSDSVKMQLEVVKRNADKLLQLTNDLLNIQGTQEGKLEIKPEKLNIQETLRQCTEEIQPLLIGKKQEVTLEVSDKPILVLGDRLRLSEVMMNLLNNASKFGPDGGRITIRVEDGETVGHCLRSRQRNRDREEGPRPSL